ncbi:dihydrodipicolinate synthase family protein [Vibrio diazotrophicus]|uniref:Dihydrodipicolinate synthase family protein n=1 Tax=Vibrio diazotrophicus TaxID=685 RepID=A0A2J8HWF3_VIBDI|nr:MULTISPECIES: dihydrodipicolinate synthase family protein [Vibrio]MCF7363771.1 dihydrodipicolinate synthase family protein [Vibrio sp. A1-b2]PNI02597.1 dihydrodipicolinate synthase family protein [Vibrio diazotrophicus]
MKRIEGIVPVMLTPFTNENKIDYKGLENLIDWYIDNGADALFAVCQSSEMLFLSLEERVALSKFVVDYTNGRVPVISSGHISPDINDQITELNEIAKTGIDALVLVSNRLDPNNEGTEKFLHNLTTIMEALPKDMPLGLYECPAPYRRLLTDKEIEFCANSGRFVVLKDVSCDLETVKRRVKLVEGTPFAIINANAAIAYEAMQNGSKGFSGVFTNFHPDLYNWLYHHASEAPEYAEKLSRFLSLSAVTETLGYPKNAKVFHQRLGTFSSTQSRVTDADVLEKFWGLSVILDQIASAAQSERDTIKNLNK